MSIEIKFRAWDKDSSEMIYSTDKKQDFYFDFNRYGMNLMLPVEDNYPEVRECFIMQYSGLSDKNKKEIYAGDILQVVNESGENILVICEYGIARRKIKGHKITECDISCFYFKLPNGIKSFPIVCNYKGIHDLQLMEIIGNIYENPDLLTN